MEVTLRILNEKANARLVRLQGDTMIGRGGDAHLRVGSAEVSRRHCLIVIGVDTVMIRDLASSNGTRVNGEFVEPGIDVLLEPDSQVEVGPLRFLVEFAQIRTQAPVISDETRDDLPPVPASRHKLPSSVPRFDPPDELTEFDPGEPDFSRASAGDSTEYLPKPHSESSIELPAADLDDRLSSPELPPPETGPAPTADGTPRRQSLFRMLNPQGPAGQPVPNPPASPGRLVPRPPEEETVSLEETLSSTDDVRRTDPPPAAAETVDPALQDFLRNFCP